VKILKSWLCSFSTRRKRYRFDEQYSLIIRRNNPFLKFPLVTPIIAYVKGEIKLNDNLLLYSFFTKLH